MPQAQQHAAEAGGSEPRFHPHPFGVWSDDTTLAFHEPEADGYVSHSATNMHHTRPAFTAAVRSIDSVMRALGHDHLDLLKLSAEGAEYEILRSLVEREVDVTVLSVSFDQPAPPGLPECACDLLASRGYQIVHAEISPRICKVTFVKEPIRQPVAWARRATA